jgi:hypothetical protein
VPPPFSNKHDVGIGCDMATNVLLMRSRQFLSNPLGVIALVLGGLLALGLLLSLGFVALAVWVLMLIALKCRRPRQRTLRAGYAASLAHRDARGASASSVAADTATTVEVLVPASARSSRAVPMCSSTPTSTLTTQLR